MYSTPIRLIITPLTTLINFVRISFHATEMEVQTYIRSTFSSFIAGRSVKVLMTKQETAHAALSRAFERTKDMPHVRGHMVPKMNRPVRISR